MPVESSDSESDFDDIESSDDDDEEYVVAIVKRRRLAHAAALQRQKSGPRGKKRKPLSYFSWTDHLHRLSPREFKARYRLDLKSFNHLHNLIKSRIETGNKAQASRTRVGGEVQSEVRLAIALRYLAGGQVSFCGELHFGFTQCISFIFCMHSFLFSLRTSASSTTCPKASAISVSGRLSTRSMTCPSLTSPSQRTPQSCGRSNSSSQWPQSALRVHVLARAGWGH